MSRKIVVISKDELFDGKQEYFNGFCGEINFRGIPEAAETTVRNSMLMDKVDAEISPTHKQIIPYILVVCPSANKIMTYRRAPKGGDPRLQGLYSIGVGGHIEESDISESLEETIHACMVRELREEITLDYMSEQDIRDQLIIAGYVNEDETEVGRVHFGVVYTLNISEEVMSNGVKVKEEEFLKNVEFLDMKILGDIAKPQLELWTRLCIPFVLENLAQ